MANNSATRDAYGEFLVEYGADRKDLIVMNADLSGSNKTNGFEKAYPDRFIECGIAEQDMMAEAAGLAHSGKVVAASSFTMFAAGRAFEVIRNSIAHTNANVKVCATHAGVTVGEDGATHQTIEDIAIMRTMPGMIVLNPADANSTKVLLHQLFEIEGPAYVRLSRSGMPQAYEESQAAELRLGKGAVVREGKDVAIIGTGLMVSVALEAADMLAAEGINARVIDMHTVKPIDEQIIIEAAKDCGAIVTAEEHSVIGGLGAAVAEVVVQNCPVKMEMVGIKDTFGESGKPAELLEKYGLTANDIVAAVKKVK